MRRLLDWTRFGPAHRDYIDWVEGASPLPSTDRQLPDQKWNELTSGEATSTEVIIYIIIAAASLLFLSLLGFLLCRRRCSTGKLGVANVIALADLQDPERNVELLSSIRRGRDAFPSSSSDPELGEGVFLMVYLSAPYEETLTQLARAASISSSRGAEPPGRHSRASISSRAVEEPASISSSRSMEPPGRAASISSSRGVEPPGQHSRASISSSKWAEPPGRAISVTSSRGAEPSRRPSRAVEEPQAVLKYQEETRDQRLDQEKTSRDQVQIHPQDKTQNQASVQPQDTTQNQDQIHPQIRDQAQIHPRNQAQIHPQNQSQIHPQNQSQIHPQDQAQIHSQIRDQAQIHSQDQAQICPQGEAPIQPQE